MTIFAIVDASGRVRTTGVTADRAKHEFTAQWIEGSIGAQRDPKLSLWENAEREGFRVAELTA